MWFNLGFRKRYIIGKMAIEGFLEKNIKSKNK